MAGEESTSVIYVVSPLTHRQSHMPTSLQDTMLLNNEPMPGLLCIKYILVFFNLIFVITGICLILVGWSINYIYFEYSEFLEAHFFSPGALMITVGFLVFAVAFFGCCGAYKESTCMVSVFSVLLGLVFTLELAAALSAYLLQSDIHQLLEHTIGQTLLDSPNSNTSAHMMDVMQSELQCCGLYSFKDWDGVYPETNTSIILPESCCASHGVSDTNCTQVYESGCLSQLETFIHESVLLLVGTASTIALIQLIGVFFSCSLAKMIRIQKTERERRRWEMREQLISGYTQGKGEPGPVMYMTITDLRPKS